MRTEPSPERYEAARRESDGLNKASVNSGPVEDNELRRGPQDRPLHLNEHWRVVFDPLQWILQKRQGRWRDRCFCVTRVALLRCIREYCGAADISEVERFPDWHPDRSAATAVKAPTSPTIPTEAASALLPASKSVCA